MRRRGMTPRSRTTVFSSGNSPSRTSSSSSAIGTTGISDELNTKATTTTVLEDDGRVDDETRVQSSSLSGEADDDKDQTESSPKRPSPFDRFKYRDDGPLQAQSGNHDTATMKRQRVTRSNPVSSSSSSSSSASIGQAPPVDQPDQVVKLTPVKKLLSTSSKSPSRASKPTSFYPTKAILSSSEAYCAPSPYKYRCRFKSTCDECFHASLQCAHSEEAPLKLLLIGHNPSTHVWDFGYNYGNPTNRMWKLLTGELGDFEGLLPRGSPIELQNRLPSEFEIGLTDVALVPGNDAAELSDKVMLCWRPNLYARLKAHVERVNQATYLGPSICAFTGKRQFTTLFESGKAPKNVPFGRLPADLPLPPNWPFPHSQVWVLPSSSGRAAMTHEQRFTPYKQLAEELRRLRAGVDDT